MTEHLDAVERSRRNNEFRQDIEGLQDRHREVVEKIRAELEQSEQIYTNLLATGGSYLADQRLAKIECLGWVLDLLEPPQPKMVEEVIERAIIEIDDNEEISAVDERSHYIISALRSNPDAVRQLLEESE